jgi:hypothetical protein
MQALLAPHPPQLIASWHPSSCVPHRYPSSGHVWGEHRPPSAVATSGFVGEAPSSDASGPAITAAPKSIPSTLSQLEVSKSTTKRVKERETIFIRSG